MAAAYYQSFVCEALEKLDVETVKPLRTHTIALEVTYRAGEINEKYDAGGRSGDHEEGGHHVLPQRRIFWVTSR